MSNSNFTRFILLLIHLFLGINYSGAQDIDKNFPKNDSISKSENVKNNFDKIKKNKSSLPNDTTKVTVLTSESLKLKKQNLFMEKPNRLLVSTSKKIKK